MATNTPSVLFVCLGNICRSPSAEAVFKTKAADNGLVIEIGYSFKGLKCRKVVQQDFEKFDYILGMDNQNIASLLEACPEELQHKVTLLLSFSDAEEREVPDPYYGGKGGFEYVLDLIEQGADGFIKHLKSSTS
jgi:protein-tyrosine phosphatase